MSRGGARPGAGRKSGTLTLKKGEVREFLSQRNFDPFAKLVELYDDPGTDTGTRVKIAVELARYCAPQLKAVDIEGKGAKQEAITVILGLPRREQQMIQVNTVPSRTVEEGPRMGSERMDGDDLAG
jgi:hypothetical protein